MSKIGEVVGCLNTNTSNWVFKTMIFYVRVEISYNYFALKKKLVLYVGITHLFNKNNLIMLLIHLILLIYYMNSNEKVYIKKGTKVKS